MPLVHAVARRDGFVFLAQHHNVKWFCFDIDNVVLAHSGFSYSGVEEPFSFYSHAFPVRSEGVELRCWQRECCVKGGGAEGIVNQQRLGFFVGGVLTAIAHSILAQMAPTIFVVVNLGVGMGCGFGQRGG